MSKFIVWGKKCPVCNGVLSKRLKRSLWMRLIPRSRKFFCNKCDHTLFFVFGSTVKLNKKRKKKLV